MDGDVPHDDRPLVDALAALAARPRDLEGERVFAKLRRELADAPAPPPHVGRFEVLGQIGAGAMGIVYRARDPQLHREVAIKVLHEGRPHDELALREARALARLSHPNAVTIYEVGEERGAIFVAMELVRGETLRRWLATPRSAPRILEVLLDAGRGLAAAHRAGLVHGDFKPDNILVGEDRVRVADFGLARLAGDERPEEGGSRLLAGTPAYMSPEQLAGDTASPAADQFSFAATLFEALTGERPYAGADVESLREQMRAGPITSERLARLPRWLQRLLRRALEPEPQRRYRDMDALLAELDRRPAARRRRIVLAFATAAMIAVAVFAYRQGRAHDPCAGASAHTDRAWSSTRRAGARQAFAKTRVPRALATYEQIHGAIEDYLGRWRRSYRAVCEATRVRAEQSEALLDARIACLKRRLARLEALTDLFAGVRSGAELLAAQRAVSELPAVATCRTRGRMAAEDASPKDAALRGRVATLSRHLHRAWALYALGRYRDAARYGARFERSLAGLAWPAARAQWLLFLGAVRGRTGAPGQAAPLLQEALEAAARARADSLVRRIWRRLLKDALFSGAYQRVAEWASFARAATVRAGGPAAEIDAIVGEAQLLAGQTRQAYETLKAAFRALEARVPGRTLAIVLSNLGNAQLGLGQVAAAEGSYRLALNLVTRQLGEHHPTRARFIDKLGRIARARGDLKTALDLHRQALTIREAAFGENDRTVASSLLELGRAEIAAGRGPAARVHLSRALTLRRRAYGKGHLRLADIHEARGEASLLLGKTDAARADWRRALAIREAHSPNHPGLKRLRCLLGLDVVQSRDRAAAVRACKAR